jgi:hypothetical protein
LTERNDPGEALLARAGEAVRASEQSVARATELIAFVRALRPQPPGTTVLCAWCGKIAGGGYWLDPKALMGGPVPTPITRRSSHSICPACFEDVSLAAAKARPRT